MKLSKNQKIKALVLAIVMNKNMIFLYSNIYNI